MQTILRWTARCLAAAALVISLPASAYLQFTYTSQPLPLTSYLVEGSSQDLIDPPLAAPAFTLSFRAPEQDLSLQPLTPFIAESFAFSLTTEPNYIDYPIDIDPASYGQVSLTGDGTVAGWDLMVQMKELITPETDLQIYEMSDHHVSVVSNSETGDQLISRFHPVTWHRENWIQLVQLEFAFTNESERGSWTVEQIDLPEPGLAGLLVTGLSLLLWSRRRIKAPATVKNMCEIR